MVRRATRQPAGADRVRALMRMLGRAARSDGTVYLVGGSSAVLVGWRETTVDVDLELDPEPQGVFDAIARAKEALNVNVELAAPDDFIPPLPGWRRRSPFIERIGRVDYCHYDFHAQALAKIERGHELDLADLAAMHERGLIAGPRLMELFGAIEAELMLYPALDPRSFRARVVAGGGGDGAVSEARSAIEVAASDRQEVADVPGDLPGAGLVARGIDDLRAGRITVESLLVAVGARRMRAAGLDVPPGPRLGNPPEALLYLKIGETHPDDAHSRYNALIWRLVSFERALERSAAARVRRGERAPAAAAATGSGRSRGVGLPA